MVTLNIYLQLYQDMHYAEFGEEEVWSMRNPILKTYADLRTVHKAP